MVRAGRPGVTRKMAHAMPEAEYRELPGTSRGRRARRRKCTIPRSHAQCMQCSTLSRPALAPKPTWRTHTHTHTYGQTKRNIPIDLTLFSVPLLLCELQWLSKRALFAAGGCAVSHSSDMNAESLDIAIVTRPFS